MLDESTHGRRRSGQTAPLIGFSRESSEQLAAEFERKRIAILDGWAFAARHGQHPFGNLLLLESIQTTVSPERRSIEMGFKLFKSRLMADDGRTFFPNVQHFADLVEQRPLDHQMMWGRDPQIMKTSPK